MTMRALRAGAIIAAAVAIAAAFAPQRRLPRFEEYPAGPVYRGDPPEMWDYRWTGRTFTPIDSVATTAR
jgi:hypothetical protein